MLARCNISAVRRRIENRVIKGEGKKRDGDTCSVMSATLDLISCDNHLSSPVKSLGGPIWH